jgi:hypothetical protein
MRMIRMGLQRRPRSSAGEIRADPFRCTLRLNTPAGPRHGPALAYVGHAANRAAAIYHSGT